MSFPFLLRRTALAVTLVLAAAPARAQDAPSPGADAGADHAFSLRIGLARGHDDNVLQMTPHGFDRFATNPAAPRFLIASPGDDVNRAAVDAAWSGRLLRRRATRVAASLDLRDYQLDHVMNWHALGAGVTQELTGSRRHLVTLKLTASDLPRYYLGEITDDDASSTAGTRIRHSLTYAQFNWGMRLEREMLRRRLWLGAGYEDVRRDYNANFDERDNHNRQGRFTAEARPAGRGGIVLRAQVLLGTLHARGDLPATPVLDNDISYAHHGVGGGVSVPWGSRAARGHVDVDLMPEARVYSTRDKFDVTRFGRTNHRLETSLRLVQALPGPLEVVVTYSHLASDATFDPAIAIPTDQTDFRQTQYGLMLRGRVTW